MNQYFENMVLSANSVELIRLLYGKAIASVQEARLHLASGRISARSASVSNAWLVVMELSNALKPEVAPELTERLRALYAYIQTRLVDGNLEQADTPLAEVLSLLSTLSEAWAAIPEPMAQTISEQVNSSLLSRNTGWDTYEAPGESARYALSA